MLYRQSTEEHVFSLFGIAQVFMEGDCMSRIVINEPFAPRRRHLIIDSRRRSTALPKLAATSGEDACMILVLVSLLLTTLLLPWIVL
jgi:hypothetical protein